MFVKIKRFLTALLPGTFLLAAAFPLPASAHHSFGMFSEDLSLIEGELIDIAWRNPHVIFTLSVPSESGGESVQWIVEGGAVYVLQRRDITNDMFKVGDQISVLGRANRNGEPEMLTHNILLPDGREVLMAQGAEPYWTRETVGGTSSINLVDAEEENLGIFRVWSRGPNQQVNYGAGLPYIHTPREVTREWVDRLYGMANRCESTGMPGVMATPYPFEFTDEGDSIRVQGLASNALIDRRIHLSSQIDSAEGIMGESIGRWDGNTLRVETTNIDWPYFDDSTGLEQSQDMKVVELFELSADQTRLDYLMTVTDPALFSEPAVVIDFYWLALGETRAMPEACLE